MTQITNKLLCSGTNNAFRSAFGSISRAALPFMADDAYFTDLLHDAAQAVALEEEGRFYLLVRRLGTNAYAYPDDAQDYLLTTDGVAVLRVRRGKYDTFHTDVIHIDAERAAHYGVTAVMREV
jgi:hypothetical protein